MTEIGPEQASFFMLTPLPGSRDHWVLTAKGAELDEDLNRYDSFHATSPHPLMSRAEWTQAYEDAWRMCYSVQNMTRILRRVRPENYWAVFANFIWYKHSIEVEQGHPMLHGFLRFKGRRQRRPGLPLETRWQYAGRRIRDVARYVRGWPRLALTMEEVWLATRPRSALEQRVVEELQRVPASIRGWRRLRIAEIRRAYRQAAAALRHSSLVPPPLSHRYVPPRALLWLRRWNPCAQSLTWSRHSIRRFWKRCVIQLRRGELHRLDVSGLLFNAAQEAALFATFASLFFSRLLTRLFARGTAGVSPTD